MSDESSPRLMAIPEMRLMIWEASVPPSRRIYLHHTLNEDHGSLTKWNAKLDSDASSPNVVNPAILRLCQESRDYLIREKGYTLFGTHLKSPIYMNHSKDQLWFLDTDHLWYFHQAVLLRHQPAFVSEVKKVGVKFNISTSHMFTFRRQDIASGIATIFPEVEEVIFEIPEEEFKLEYSEMKELRVYQRGNRGIVSRMVKLSMVFKAKKVAAISEDDSPPTLVSYVSLALFVIGHTLWSFRQA